MSEQRSDQAGEAELRESAERLLDLHRRAGNVPEGQQANEAEVVDGIIDLLVTSGLTDRTRVRREADRVDIRTDDLIIEVKKRIGIGTQPDSEHVAQLDRYLRRARESSEQVRLGILTDGKYWLLRTPKGGKVRTLLRDTFELHADVGVNDLVAWLRDVTQALPSQNQVPEPPAIETAFGKSISAKVFVDDLAQLYDEHCDNPTVTVKRDLWHNLLAAALGEVVNDETDLGRLFVRHTYLSMIVSLAVQAAFGIDITSAAANRPTELINGDIFIQEIGIRGVIESDFFGWPVETETGCEWIAGLALRVAGFDWDKAEYDFARVLYQTVIRAEDRKRLGEYYTPDWLATAIVQEVVDDPLKQRVLDPACGSGTFLRAAIIHYISKAESAGLSASKILTELREKITGIDTHPVAVHLARATWVMAAKKVISQVEASSLTVPVYLGDSLQLHSDPGSLFGDDNVTIEVRPAHVDGSHKFLHFPKTLVARGDWFDGLMLKAAGNIEAGMDPMISLDEAGTLKDSERTTLKKTLGSMIELHAEGRDHIWAYYTRNLVRPVWLSTDEGQVDRIVGNPPWLTYSQTESTIRSELERQSKSEYGIWAGRQYAPHQDVAGLFFTRSLDLYLKDGGQAGMVLPHSALGAGQYEKWRSGSWGGIVADLSAEPWDLERIEPNTFFPVPACVAFARKGGSSPRCLPPTAQRWLGPEGGPNPKEWITLVAFGEYISPYSERARQGATIVPRLLFFVDATESPIALVKGILKVQPVRSANEKEPWKSLDPFQLYGPMDDAHVHRVHLGSTVAPFVMLEALSAVLPLRRGEKTPSWPGGKTAMAGVDPVRLGERMRSRWRDMSSLWDAHKKPTNKLTLIDRLDYHKGLSSQLGDHPIRLVYTTSGRPTAAILTDDDAFLDHKLFWLPCPTLAEAFYLVAVINSKTLYRLVEPFMSKGQMGPRDLHKHLWRLPIVVYDPDNPVHRTLADLGSAAADQAGEVLAEVKRARAAAGKKTTVNVARKAIRAWLDDSEVGRDIETHVEALLSG